MSTPVILLPHLGFDTDAPKSAVVRTDVAGARIAATLTMPDGAQVRLGGAVTATVDAWSTGAYGRIELPAELAAGDHVLHVTDGERCAHASVRVADDRVIGQTVSDVLAYFRAARSSGEIDRTDADARRIDDPDGRGVDASGGWLDASGDTSKFLSHLSYTQMMSPQQIPLVVWALLDARERVAARRPRFTRVLGSRLRDEALFGADFLTRFRAPHGAFYLGIFDGLTKELDERVINAPLPECVRTPRYHASFRAGGGMAVAALARAATIGIAAEHTPAAYLDAARTAYADLVEHNADYLFGLDLASGELTPSDASIIDDYCALLAATELAAATGEDAYRSDAADHARRLIERYDARGWFIGASDGRPYFHAAEPGLPLIALARFRDVLPEHAAVVDAFLVQVAGDMVARTDAVANPFGLPRQHARWSDGEERDTFFFPHANDTGYWWQGENAGIASVSAAASTIADLPTCPEPLRARLRRLAADQLDWVLGRNPFDACMLQGRGRNNVEYHVEYPNLPGGIVNGVTSGFADEHDIAFIDPTHPDDSWRWSEQWIPHSAWFILAVAAR